MGLAGCPFTDAMHVVGRPLGTGWHWTYWTALDGCVWRAAVNVYTSYRMWHAMFGMHQHQCSNANLKECIQVVTPPGGTAATWNLPPSLIVVPSRLAVVTSCLQLTSC